MHHLTLAPHFSPAGPAVLLVWCPSGSSGSSTRSHSALCRDSLLWPVSCASQGACGPAHWDFAVPCHKPCCPCGNCWPCRRVAAAGPLDPAASISCDVCMCESPGSECGRNGCGHAFCNTCWAAHLAVQIKEGKARHISCMAFKCGVVCDEDLVVSIIKVRCAG